MLEQIFSYIPTYFILLFLTLSGSQDTLLYPFSSTSEGLSLIECACLKLLAMQTLICYWLPTFEDQHIWRVVWGGVVVGSNTLNFCVPCMHHLLWRICLGCLRALIPVVHLDGCLLTLGCAVGHPWTKLRLRVLLNKACVSIWGGLRSFLKLSHTSEEVGFQRHDLNISYI